MKRLTARSLIVFCTVAALTSPFVLAGCTREDPPDLTAPISTASLEKASPVRFRQLQTSPVSIKLGARNDPNPPSHAVRGIYVSSFAALTPSKMQSLMKLLDQTELNAVVLDVNSGARLLSLPRSPRQSSFARSDSPGARRLRQAARELKRRRVYLIARVVTFKDFELAAARPEWALKRKDGAVWRDASGHAWIDPYKEEAWAYPAAVAAEAAACGFDEVQFDYVRFPENPSRVDREAAYSNPLGRSKSETIRRFMRYAAGKARARGVRVSADVFGMVGSTHGDMGIGQRWQDLALETDVLSPMVYPSHYSPGTWGIPHPDLSPGPIIARALQDAAGQNLRLKRSGKQPSQIRPWIQGFTAGWIHPHQRYGPAQIRDQIRAARQAGFSSYLIWNSSCRYPIFRS
ncbi:putative glycoside hydrolase [Cohnella sp. CFH 77786]|uniref:putative glycoside hydrolase n=1 Tax=Cohnella sp. CFH 77786 TaxID=2662265 RepID=UPI001C60A271